MEFWGVEVKAGEPLKVTPQMNKLIHISQAALGEVKNKKGNDSVPLRLKVDDGKFVIGMLSADSTPQLTFDLVFEKSFELSHDWKNGSIYFCGYTADNPYAEDEDESDDDFSSEEDEEFPLHATQNGKPDSAVEQVKPAKLKATAVKTESSAKATVTPVEPKKDIKPDDSDDDTDGSDEADEDSEDMSEGDLAGVDSMDYSDDSEEDESDDEDKETPKKADPSKKRPSESMMETPTPAKKAKSATPQKTDGKKVGSRTATPHPSKPAGKTSANKSKEQTPKSSGQASCKSCSKIFNSDSALQSHTKAKHGGK